MSPALRRIVAPALLLALLAACKGKSPQPPVCSAGSPSSATAAATCGAPAACSPPACGTTGSVTAGSAWQLYTPTDWNGACSLTVQVPALGPGERLAVLLANAGGGDRSPATVTVTGTGAPSPAAAPAALASLSTGGGPNPSGLVEEAFDHAPLWRGQALVTALREETAARLRDGRLQRVVRRASPGVAPALAAAAPATRSFCQGRYGAVAATTQNPDGFARFWLPASLAFESAHAAFYYVDEVKAGIDAAVAARAGVAPAGVAPFWGELAAAFESRVFPALTTYFGQPSDVDGNGKVIFLFGNLGATDSCGVRAFTLGYFWSVDLDRPLATAATCSTGALGSTGNHADMLYLMDPGTFTGLVGGTGSGYAAVLDGIVKGDYPGVMAHELQHDVNYNTRFPQGGPPGVDEETWLDEGLSMLSETVAGYGLHTASGRSAVRYYLGEVDPRSCLPYHRTYSLTTWEGDPRGNYAAVQAYMQYLLDHASPAMTRALENPALAGKANVAAATGVPWEAGFAGFVTASMISNEDASATPGGTITSAGNLLASPVHSYLGDGASPDYVPWHHYTGYCTTSDGVRHDKARLARVAYTPLATSSCVTLRQDGWAAFATGPGSGGAVTITVQSGATVPPHVAVVRYTGTLPNFTPLDLSCP